MALITIVEYRHLFNDDRPDPKELLANIPSKYIIAIMAMINDALKLMGNGVNTQKFLLRNICVYFPPRIRDVILEKGESLIAQQYEIFNFIYTVEVINHELLNFKDEPLEYEEQSESMLIIFRAYMAIVEEMVEHDVSLQHEAIEKAKEGGKNIIRLMWPHLLRQFQFTNLPDIRYEINRGMAFLSFIQNHPRFGSYATKYFNTKSCTNYQDYFLTLLSLILPHLQRNPSENLFDYFYRISTNSEEPIFESLSLNPDEFKMDTKKSVDYLGLKEKPLFKFAANQYIVPYWDFFYNALFTGLIFAFYNESGIKDEFEKVGGFGKFKSIIGKEFSEELLFVNTMKKCFSNSNETLLFFNDSATFNPDCYYRKGNNIFIIEFKDYMLNSEIIQSGSYEVIEEEFRRKFVYEDIIKKGKPVRKDKGVSQLAKNIEKLSSTDALWQIDTTAKDNNLKLNDVSIYPIIIQTSIYFDFPGVNEFLDEVIQHRLLQSQKLFKEIKPFTMIDFKYFADMMLAFSDDKISLDSELDYYHKEMCDARIKAMQTQEVNDTFYSLSPFSFIFSPAYREFYAYRVKELRQTIENCWNFDLGTK